MLYWQIAFRNLLRHRGRLTLNLILLVGAFCAIICFKGFKNQVLDVIQNLVIDTQFGHIEIAKKSYWQNLSVEQAADKMISNSEELIKKVSAIKGIQYISPRVSFFGLVNTEDNSVTTRIVGIRPEAEPRMLKTFIYPEGEKFKNIKQTIVSTGIRKNLDLNLKQNLNSKKITEVTMVSPTLSGGINAMDLSVTGIFSTGFTDIDKALVYINLADAHKLLDSDYIDQIFITLDEEKNILDVIRQINEILETSEFADLEAKSWRDLADLYFQIEDYFVFQNSFVEVIILLLLFLSVTNTVSMTIFERQSEIGTLRALGDYESNIQNLFLAEAIMLGMLSVVIAIPVSFLIIHIVAILNIPVMLPMASQPMPFLFVPTWGAYVEATFVCFLSVVLASIWPAYKGARVSIVTALGAKV